MPYWILKHVFEKKYIPDDLFQPLSYKDLYNVLFQEYVASKWYIDTVSPPGFNSVLVKLESEQCSYYLDY